MKFIKRNSFALFAALVLLSAVTQQVKARESYRLTQNHEDWRQFELTAGQARSRIEHTLVNYLLGKTVDQYLDFGADDTTSRKSTKRLKLRLNRHRAILVYQHHFY